MQTNLKIISFLIAFTFLLIRNCFASDGLDSFDKHKLQSDSLYNSDQVGGRYITSKTPNSFLRMLIIFAQFPDDNWDTSWAEWPKGEAPLYIHNFIDSTTAEMSTTGNITQYFRVMSLDSLIVIGNCYSVIAPHTRKWYSSNNKGRAFINQEVIQKLNRAVNFAPFDNWRRIGQYNNVNRPDGVIDMIWVIWRNIYHDVSLSTFTFDYDFNYSGEASLGGDNNMNSFDVDNRVRHVQFGYPQAYNSGSGLTIARGYNGHVLVKQYTIHEFGHYLLGNTSFHIRTGVWGIMAGYSSRCQVVNSYERNRLGWINIKQYDYNPGKPITLRDYITTGDALRIAVPNTKPKQYYYLENHQRISPLDNIDQTTGGKGIYVLYQRGNINNDLSFYNAEGKANWSVDHFAVFPGTNVTVPVFKKGMQNPAAGYFDSQDVVYTDPKTGLKKSSFIQAYNLNGKDYFKLLFKGNGKNEMKPGYVDVFSPWSNPPLKNVSFQVVSKYNELQIKQYVVPGTLTDVPPAKPQNLKASINSFNEIVLTWTANTEPDLSSYKIYKTETNGEGAERYYYAATVSASQTRWTDTKTINENNSSKIFYKISAVDSTNKESVLSDYSTVNFIK